MTPPSSQPQDACFPRDFRWGSALSAYQAEGATAEDGRGPCVWDTYCERPGTILEDYRPVVAADFYHRFREDIAFMRWLGLDMMRHSFSWSRLLPAGKGRVNPAGLAYYDRLIDALLEAGIEPWFMLYHWDLPNALEQHYGGWTSPEIPRYFADFATMVATHFSDRVRHFLTTDEFACFTDNGYLLPGTTGWFAPGRVVDNQTRNQTRHHALLAHGLAVQALRAAARQPLSIGFSENPTPTVPVIATEEHIAAARRALRALSAPFLTTVMEGRYPEEYLRAQGTDAPRFTAGEMDIIRTPVDFVGINLFAATHVRAASDQPGGWEIVPPGSGYPRMNAHWFHLDPEILYWTPRFLKELWNVAEIYVTSNGCTATDQMDRTGGIQDTDRVFFLRTHLRAAARAVAEGWPVKGYFHWSLVDSFEWGYGCTKRLGLAYVNFQTLARTPKLSAHFYRETISRRQVA